VRPLGCASSHAPLEPEGGTTGGDAPGFRGSRILRDRDRDGAYLVIAEFDSYEQAMESSGCPQTDAFARRMRELVDGAPVYGNYDVIAEE
jgi:antibiotic biosynthesis monooxygenase (ABM) superfamily enzyme